MNRFGKVDDFHGVLVVPFPRLFDIVSQELDIFRARRRLAELLTEGRPGGYRGPLRFEVK